MSGKSSKIIEAHEDGKNFTYNGQDGVAPGKVNVPFTTWLFRLKTVLMAEFCGEFTSIEDLQEKEYKLDQLETLIKDEEKKSENSSSSSVVNSSQRTTDMARLKEARKKLIEPIAKAFNVLIKHLNNDAIQFIIQLGNEYHGRPGRCIQKLSEQYDRKDAITAQVLLTKLANFKRQKNETARDMFKRMRTLFFNLAEHGHKQTDPQMVSKLLQTLSSTKSGHTMASQIILSNFDFARAENHVVQMEELRTLYRSDKDEDDEQDREHALTTQISKQKWCKICMTNGHSKVECEKFKKFVDKAECWICHKKGHLSHKCPQKPSEKREDRQALLATHNIMCGICLSKEHLTNECDEEREFRANMVGVFSSSKTTNDTTTYTPKTSFT
jgi:hypothetical protein